MSDDPSVLATAKWFEGAAQGETATGPQERYAAVEIFGHRRHVGRVIEVEQFGTKMLRIDVPKDGDFEKGYVSHFYGGASIFSIVPTDMATVKRANEPYDSRRAIGHYRSEDEDDHE